MFVLMQSSFGMAHRYVVEVVHTIDESADVCLQVSGTFGGFEACTGALGEENTADARGGSTTISVRLYQSAQVCPASICHTGADTFLLPIARTVEHCCQL